MGTLGTVTVLFQRLNINRNACETPQNIFQKLIYHWRMAPVSMPMVCFAIFAII